MTEQPVEPMTEQAFLGNAPAATVTELPVTPALAEAREHYAPNAHLRRPSWAPVDDVELASLVRKSINANKLLAITRAEAKKAEDALTLALLVEDEAAHAVRAANEDLITFTRKDTGL